MVNKLVKMLKQWQIILLLVALTLCTFAINYQFGNQGVVINHVEFNSSAHNAGILPPSGDISPTDREHIFKVNSQDITTTDNFYNAVEAVQPGETFRIITDKQTYVLIKQNESSAGITVTNAPSSNIKKGLELQGGTRVLLRPVGKANDQDIKDIIDTMSERLNVYGLTDLTIKSASDLEGNKYIVVEIAGATKEEVKELIAKQGKFEAKIGNETVFIGGNRDITFVCRNDGTCSRISQCSAAQEGYYCRFEFEISLSAQAAKRHADITKDLGINLSSSGQRILSENLDFYLDDKPVDSLQVDAGLKGQEATRVTISGPGTGRTTKEAQQNAIANRNKLQTILLTGSLPTQLEIVKLDTISPSLGKSFVDNILLIGLLATLIVALIILIRYRRLKIAIPMIVTILSEIYIILGLAALFKYNLDVAAIAAILASVGTGVDNQIMITDEVIHGEETDGSGNVKARIKKAFFVILAAYATIVVAMLPLLKAGAGLLTGFALVTIAGVTIGVFITRPAFGAMIRILLEE